MSASKGSKRKNNMLDPAESNSKSGKTASDASAAAPSTVDSPLCSFVSDFMQCLSPAFDKIKKLGPESFGGTQAYTNDSFKKEILKGKEFVCHLTAGHFAIDLSDNAFVEPGDIMRVYRASLYDETTNQPKFNVDWQYVVGIFSANSFPVYGEVEMLNNIPLFYAALLAASVGIKQGGESEKEAMHMLRRFKTKFVVVTTTEERDALRWRLPEEALILAETVVVKGLKRCYKIVRLAERLRSRNQAKTDDDVLAWFKKMPNSQEPITKSVLSQTKRIVGRFDRCANAILANGVADSEWGRRHFLAHTSVLDSVLGDNN
jgi:hypothetical protein